MKNIKVSIIMSAYNAEKYIYEAIQSVVSQTEQSWELLITDDKSTDNTLKIIKSFEDSRIKIIENISQIGLTKNLIHMIREARGKYIARLDADDICKNDRIKTQADYLDSHDCVMVCSFAESFGEKKGLLKQPLEFEKLKANLLVGNPIVHSSVMFRKSESLNYNEEFLKTQDYEFWDRIISENLKIGIINRPLVEFRYHKGQISHISASTQVNYSNRIRKRALERLGLNMSDEYLNEYFEFLNYNRIPSRESFQHVKTILISILQLNKNKHIYKQRFLRQVVGFILLKLIDRSFVNIKDCIKILPYIPVSVMVKYCISKYN